MAQSELSDLFRALVHVGSVEAVKQNYQVYRTAAGRFLVFSPSNRGSTSFHMTMVPEEKVEALADVLGKEEVTTGSLMKEKKLEGAFDFGDKVAVRFDLLMGLYVLTAMGRAEMKKSGRNLVFTRRTEGS